MKINISSEDLEIFFYDIEKAIESSRTDSTMRSLKHQYFLTNQELEMFDKIYFILSAQIRKNVEAVYNRYEQGLYKELVEQKSKKKSVAKKTVSKSQSSKINTEDAFTL